MAQCRIQTSDSSSKHVLRMLRMVWINQSNQSKKTNQMESKFFCFCLVKNIKFCSFLEEVPKSHSVKWKLLPDREDFKRKRNTNSGRRNQILWNFSQREDVGIYELIVRGLVASLRRTQLCARECTNRTELCVLFLVHILICAHCCQ